MRTGIFDNFAMRLFFVLTVVLAFTASSEAAKKKVEPPPPEARPVRVMTLEGNDGGTVKSYPGKTEAQDTVDVSFEVMGKIVELPIQRGTAVKAGDIIAKLDASDFENDFAAKKSEYQKALSELNRYRDLYEKDAVSRQELETKERNKDVTQANMKIAEKKVNDTILKAPFSGVVAVQYIENFQSVQAKEPIVRIQNNEAIEIVVYVPERDLSLLQTSKMKSAKAVFDAFPEQGFDLTLREFETQADPVTQTFKVKFTLPQLTSAKVLPGMSANVTIDFERKEGQTASSLYLLPSSAVTADPSGKSFVWVVDAQAETVHRRDVEMGEVTGTGSVQIKSGLEPGMTIVTAGIRELREGMKVRPKNENMKIAE